MPTREEKLFKKAQKAAKIMDLPLQEFLNVSSSIISEILASRPSAGDFFRENADIIARQQETMEKALERRARRTDAGSQIFL